MIANLFTTAALALMLGAGPTQDTSPLTDTQRTAVVQDIARKLTDGYLYADKGKEFAEYLETRLAEGAYDDLVERRAFAAQLSAELFELSNDKHLKIMLAQPGGAPAGGGRTMIRRRVSGDPGDEGGGPTRVQDGGSWPGMPDFRRVNHGFQELRLMEGNVGYIDLRTFSPSPDALARVDAVMAFFDSVDALIIDIGRNPGGAGTIIPYLSGYLFSEPTHLSNSFQRGMEEPHERWTAKDIKGRLRPDLPVFLVTSRGTGSAAESFTFGLKVTERVTLVGERTAGAGNFGDTLRPLPEGFQMFLPIGSTYDPRTGKGFEAEGIEPDYAVPYADAVREAHVMAVDAGSEYRDYMEDLAAAEASEASSER